jgi:cystathionine beta-lyase
LFADVKSMTDTWDPTVAAYSYGLYGTPTTLELAARVAELEGGFRSLITPGGQAALALVYLAFLRPGDHVLVPQSVYGPSRNFADAVLTRFGMEVDYYAPTAAAKVEHQIRENTRLIWCESPGSITMDVQDVDAISEVAHRRGLTVALDNTWSAGVFFRPFDHGVDVSIQALTKYVGGHSDLLLGTVTAKDAGLFERVGELQFHLGYGVSPDECSLALRGLQTLGVRLSAIEESALEVARWLSARTEVERVLHPALPSCPGHDIWGRDFTGSSGVFSIVLAPRYSESDVFAFVDGLRLFKIGYSWGGVTSLAIPGRGQTARSDWPYGDRLVRLNIGLEATTDLIADLDQALSALPPDRADVARVAAS